MKDWSHVRNHRAVPLTNARSVQLSRYLDHPEIAQQRTTINDRLNAPVTAEVMQQLSQASCFDGFKQQVDEILEPYRV